MRRYGMVIRVKPEGLAEYKRLHANPWPEVNAILRANGFRAFTIYEKDHLLFGTFEFAGDDLQAAFAAMAAEPIYQKWLALCDPLQTPLESRRPGEWWAAMDEIYHLD
jgi:L-rhamnose mutarotase